MGLTLVSLLIILMFLVIPVHTWGPSPRMAEYAIFYGRFVRGNVPGNQTNVLEGTWIRFSYNWTTVDYPTGLQYAPGLQYAQDFIKDTRFEAWLDGDSITLIPVLSYLPTRCEALGWTQQTGFMCYTLSYTYTSQPLPVGAHWVRAVITFTDTLYTDGWTGPGGKMGGAPLAISGQVWSSGNETFRVVTA